jgi:phosphatidyl-myo-inositol dimannoside synthase
MGVAEVAQAGAANRPQNGGTSAVRPLKVHLWAPAFTGFGGGITAFSRELALGLADLGHEVLLFGKTDPSGTWSGMTLRGTGREQNTLKTIQFAAATIDRAGRDKPDRIISTHVNFGAAAYLSKRFFRIPFTLVAHGIDVHPHMPRRTLVAMRAADRIVAMSGWTRGRVLSLGGIEAGNVTTLPNTADETRFTVDGKSRALLSKYSIAPGERIVLTVARLDATERYKGYDRVIEALPSVIAQCGPVRFMIVGNGADRPRVEALARRHGVEDRVAFAGFVPDDELADYYRLADVFAMPSTGEGFGIVFLEAMACGTPVLAGNCDGSSDALASGELGLLVNPLDVGEIGSGISNLLQCKGPSWWFDRDKLRAEAVARFGRAAFRERLEKALGL